MEKATQVKKTNGLCLCGMHENVYELTMEDGTKVNQCGECLRGRVADGMLEL